MYVIKFLKCKPIGNVMRCHCWCGLKQSWPYKCKQNIALLNSFQSLIVLSGHFSIGYLHSQIVTVMLTSKCLSLTSEVWMESYQVILPIVPVTAKKVVYSDLSCHVSTLTCHLGRPVSECHVPNITQPGRGRIRSLTKQSACKACRLSRCLREREGKPNPCRVSTMCQALC